MWKSKLSTVAFATHNPKEKWQKGHYDFLRMSKRCELDERTPICQRILNEEPKVVLMICCPSVLCAKARFQSKWGTCNEWRAHDHCRQRPVEADRRRCSKNASTMRKDARAATERCKRRIVNKPLKCSPPPPLKISQKKVYIRLPTSGGSKGGQKDVAS